MVHPFIRKLLRLAQCLLVAALVLWPVSSTSDQAQYFYDELGRLVGVIDGSGNVAVYNYDAVGNLLSIERFTTGAFRGSEHLGAYYGHAPKSVGAICDPMAFSGVVKVAPNVLGPKHGAVTVDLLEPSQEPTEFPWAQNVTRQVFRDITPWVVITVGVVG